MKHESRLRLLSFAAILAMMSTAGLAQVAADFQCFPTCSETDARFLSLGGTGLQTTSGFKVTIELTIPADRTEFELGVFDGDTGRDEFGNFPPPPPFPSATHGHWDQGTDELVYELMADPLGDSSGSGGTVAVWFGNSMNPAVPGVWTADALEMPDNDWWNATIIMFGRGHERRRGLRQAAGRRQGPVRADQRLDSGGNGRHADQPQLHGALAGLAETTGAEFNRPPARRFVSRAAGL